MRFLVKIEVRFPATLPEAERARLLAAERERGRELLERGSIVDIWRIPGGFRNVGIWEASDATELHDLLSSLPLFSFLEADVTPLAEHPLKRSS